MTVNQAIADRIVRHRLYLLRYEAGAVRELLDAYSEKTAPLYAEIAKIRARTKRAGEMSTADRHRLRVLNVFLDASMRDLRPEMVGVLRDRIEGAASAEPRIIGTHVTASLPSEIRARFDVSPQADELTAVVSNIGGKAASALETGLYENRNAVSAVLLQAAQEGLSMPEVARLLGEVSTIERTYRNRYKVIARTEVQRVSNQAAMGTYRANLNLLRGVHYLATLDSRTCLICAPFHNVVFTFGDDGVARDEQGRPQPELPQHPLCRCFYAPVTKSWSELGLSDKLVDLDGHPANEMDFGDWLKRQPDYVAAEILGPAREKLWRKGQLPLNAFSNDGRVLSLDELGALSAA